MTTQQQANLSATAPVIFFDQPVRTATETAKAILLEVMRHRRMAGPNATCTCDACMAPHMPRITASVVANQPITLVLPAFPGKSPNQAKVLGTLPDMAEENAVKFLQQLAERIGRIYEPGAQIVLASDGRIFSDVVGLKDEDVTAYRDSLNQMIAELGLKNLSTFNLEEIYEDLSFDEMRAAVMDEFSVSVEDLRTAVKAAQTPEATADDVEMNRLYCGITRFLVEDATFPGQTISRNQIQKDARARAYGVIQRSNAWSGVVEKHFPDAVRLSIHPHGCGSAKLGIHLSEPAQADNWITPWHGVALELEDGRFVLAKRSQAETLGARIVERNGRLSHFTLVG
ncbi:MAG: pyoverdine biosynthesis protein PvcA [Cyanobacteria bacterium RYN_339]|nr:pyoverdine biosynthesis protein PvcA [Cyanobacteria bacterium RYN_339]